MNKNKIAIILGTRPEAIKLIPVYKTLQNSSALTPILISTGQHKEMLQNLFQLFEVFPDIELNVMQPDQNLTDLASRLFSNIGKVLSDSTYKAVLVQGDTTTALIGGIVAHYQKIPVGHVEAGLRTYDKWSPYPEECNRRMLGIVADYHFTPTATATAALAKEMIHENVFEVGNTVIDSLLLINKKVQRNLTYYQKRYDFLPKDTKQIILITGHRRESFGKGFQQICQALTRIAQNYPDKYLLYPVHLNPNVRSIVNEQLKNYQNIHLIDPVPYDEMIYLMDHSWLIMTDSGGIQEEAPSLNKPVIVMRDTTERPEGIEAGCSVLGKVDADSIYQAFCNVAESDIIYQQMAIAQNPYGNGDSSLRIAKILEQAL